MAAMRVPSSLTLVASGRSKQRGMSRSTPRTAPSGIHREAAHRLDEVPGEEVVAHQEPGRAGHEAGGLEQGGPVGLFVLVVLEERELQAEAVAVKRVDEHFAQVADDDAHFVHTRLLEVAQDADDERDVGDPLEGLGEGAAVDQALSLAGCEDQRTFVMHANQAFVNHEEKCDCRTTGVTQRHAGAPWTARNTRALARQRRFLAEHVPGA